MRILRTCIFFGLVLLLPTILSAQKVTTDFDHAANFSQYKTFMWIREPRMSDPLMRRRVIDAINGMLTAKGLQLVAEGGDLGIIANGATKEEHTLQTLYYGLGGGWGWRRPILNPTQWGRSSSIYLIPGPSKLSGAERQPRHCRTSLRKLPRNSIRLLRKCLRTSRPRRSYT
jgi:hypothetical protein